jgi:hypothetical protein
MKSLGKSASFATSTAVQRMEAACGVPLCTHEKWQLHLTRESAIAQIAVPNLLLNNLTRNITNISFG